MTLGELELWMQRRSWGADRRKRFAKFSANFSVCHSDQPLCKTWASIRHQAFLAGSPVDVADAWIAATAVYLDRYPGHAFFQLHAGRRSRYPGVSRDERSAERNEFEALDVFEMASIVSDEGDVQPCTVAVSKTFR